MSYERENRQAMISYFEQGSKGSALRPLLGVEVEHFVVYKDTLRAVPYDAGSAGGGVRDVLTYLSQFYPQKMYGIEGDLICLGTDAGTCITGLGSYRNHSSLWKCAGGYRCGKYPKGIKCHEST